jgi:O-antigen ligase
MTLIWLLFPASVGAVAALPLRIGATVLHRRCWSVLCLVLLPVIYLGLIREFAIGRSIVPPSLIVVSAFMLLFAVFVAMHFHHLKTFPLLFPVAWYFLAVCLSGWHSVSHLHWIRGLLEVGLAFCFLLFPHFFLQTRRQVELCVKVLVFLAVATVCFAILQAVFFVPFRGLLSVLYRREDLWWIVGWGWRGRLTGNWVHPSYLGSVLNVAAPFALLAYASAATRVRRGLSLASYLTLAAGVALTSTRTPLVAFLAGSAGFMILSREDRRVRAALACAVALVATLSVFHFRFAPPDVGSRARLPASAALVERFEPGNSRSEATLNMRWTTQGEALSLFISEPGFGIGMRNYADRARGRDPMAQFSIHNSFVQNLAELGIFGLVAFVVLIAFALRPDFRPPLCRFPELRPVRAALFCSSAAILLESLAENSLAVWQVLALFWLIRGISLVIAQRPAAFLNYPESSPGREQQGAVPAGFGRDEQVLDPFPVSSG